MISPSSLFRQPMTGGLRLSGRQKRSASDYPLVSIVTPVYNADKTLLQTLDSVRNQTYPNIEHIVVDSGSTDSTIDILRSRDETLDFWISESDDGIYDGMNKGIRFSRGELIGIINADDWYESCAVEEAMKAHKINKEAIIYGFVRKHGTGRARVMRIKASDLSTEMIPHPAVFVPCKIYERNGLFDLNYRLSADYELMLRNSVRGTAFVRVNRVLANLGPRGAGSANWLRARIETAHIRYRYRIISASVMSASIVVNTLKAIKRRVRKLFNI